MRQTRWMVGTWVFFMALSLGLFTQTGCGNHSPAGPSADLNWGNGQIYANLSGPDMNLELQVNGQPATDAVVVLSGGFPESPVTAAYSYPITDNGVFGFYQTTSFTYTAGATYTVTAKADGQSSHASVVAPGGISYSADGAANGEVTLVQATHLGSSNFCYFLLLPSYSTLATYSAFPVTLSPGSYSAGTTYDVETYLGNTTQTVHGGTMDSGKYLTIFDQWDQGVTIP